MMSIICIIFSILITALVLVEAQYNEHMVTIHCMLTNKPFEISFLVVSLIIFALGILTGVLLMLSSFFSANARYSKLKKQYNKTSLGADGAQEKIELLENKVKTLETALKSVMENKE